MRRRLRDQGRGWDVLVVAEPRRTLSSTQSQVILFQFARWHVPLSVPELGAHRLSATRTWSRRGLGREEFIRRLLGSYSLADLRRFSTASAAEAAGLDVIDAPNGTAMLLILDRGPALPNGAKPNPLASIKVRQALNYAIDRREISRHSLARMEHPPRRFCRLTGVFRPTVITIRMIL